MALVSPIWRAKVDGFQFLLRVPRANPAIKLKRASVKDGKRRTVWGWSFDISDEAREWFRRNNIRYKKHHHYGSLTGDPYIQFKSEADIMLFKLRWL